MIYDGMPVSVVDFAYEIIKMHERNLYLEEELIRANELKDEYWEAFNSSRSHSDEMFGLMLQAVILSAREVSNDVS